MSEQGLAFVEPFVASDPTDENRLLVSVSQVDAGRGVIARAFVSADRGRTWGSTELTDLRATVSNGRLDGFEDMWAAIGSRGTMYLSALGIAGPIRAPRQPDSWGRAPMFVLRSNDHGGHWSAPTIIATRSSDAPKIAVWKDSVVVVVAQLNGGDSVAHAPNEVSEYIAVFRSLDAARTFEPPRYLAFDDLGHNPVNPVFLSDGTLLVGWMDHPHWGQNGPEQRITASRILVARSQNNGQSFDIPHVVGDVERPGFPAVLRMIVDQSASSPRRDRVYVIWNGGHDEHSDLSLAYSDDSGRHWSAPRRVTAGTGADVFTAAATNPDGVLAIVWAHHVVDASRTPCYTLYTAASIDGGDSFTASVPLTEAPICPDAPGNRAITYPFYGRRDTVATSWRHGGDYIGLAATADGTFHPVWTDTRDGPFRVYTARVRLER